jgi:U6 snRNA-associated Sm-like protein LSm2
VGKEITVELKNDMSIKGRLDSVDQFLNIKLADITVQDEERYPHMVQTKTILLSYSIDVSCQ